MTELVDIEMAAHGGSVLEVRREPAGWQSARIALCAPHPCQHADADLRALPPATTG